MGEGEGPPNRGQGADDGRNEGTLARVQLEQLNVVLGAPARGQPKQLNVVLGAPAGVQTQNQKRTSHKSIR